MKNNILTIIKKELTRFFGDKRTAFSIILLPGLIIFLMYSFMGDALSNMTSTENNYVPNVYVVNLPDEFKNNPTLSFVEIEENEIDNAKKNLEESKIDLLAVFPDNFIDEVQKYSISSGLPAPEINIYFNSSSTESQTAYEIMKETLTYYESTLSNKFDINRNSDEIYDLASEKDATATIFSSMMPMLLMIFLCTGCMAVAPESIAGEKERGNIATLLITPMKRSTLALGKITSLAIISLLSAVSSTIATLLSLPKLMGGSGNDGNLLNASYYQVSDYIVLSLIILSTVLLLVALFSITSAYAKSVKEAQSFAAPIMFITMFMGVISMFGNSTRENPLLYLIPLYNSAQAMVSVFNFEVIPQNIIITFISNSAYTAIGTVLLTKMFQSEKIIFSKA